MCDYIIIMDNGIILKEGTLQQLLKNETTDKIVEFTIEKNLDFISLNSTGFPFKIHEGDSKDQGFITLKNFETDLPAFMSFLKSQNITLKHMECRRKTLDDLFISLTGRKINE